MISRKSSNVWFGVRRSNSLMVGVSPFLPVNITGQQFSKMNVRNGAQPISVAPRKRTCVSLQTINCR